MKRIIILGGGISGLSLLWNLKKTHPDQEIILLEKNDRVGGLIHTYNKEGFIFEGAARSFNLNQNGRYTLKLVEELKLQDELIFAHKKSSQKYLYINKTLKKIPKNPLTFFFSSLTRSLSWFLLKDFVQEKGEREEETVHQFFERRFGKKITNTLVSSLISGVYAGDSKKLSMKNCFPKLYELEMLHGSLIKGYFKNRKQKTEFPNSKFIEKCRKYKIASFKNGMQTLPLALYEKLKSQIYLNQSIKSIQHIDSKSQIVLDDGRTLEADQIYSTLSIHALCKILDLPNFNPVNFSTVIVVNVGYKNKVLNKKGFGYFIPPDENEEILGMIWDSSIFKEQNSYSDETRISVMIGEKVLAGVSSPSDTIFFNIALKALKNHLNIDQEPCVINVFKNYQAIPQYQVGYTKILDTIKQNFPHIVFLGSSFNGISVNDCIAKSYQVSEKNDLI